MKFNVAHQLKEPVGQIRRYHIDESTDHGSPIQGEVELLRTKRSILVTAKLKTSVKAVCSRCLDEFEYPLTLDIQEQYFPIEEKTIGLSDDQDDNGFTIDSHHILDLSEAVRQHKLSALPIKILCRQDCAGLCPKCGQNLNYGRCRCMPQSKKVKGELLWPLCLRGR